MEGAKEMATYSDLPAEILGLIAERLTFLPDLQHFAFVCKSWRLAAMENCSHIPRQPPMMMLPYEESTMTCNFFSLSERKVLRLHLPELSQKWCCGSSKGWLITIDNDLNIELLNPFSRVQFQLPPHPLFPWILDESCIHEQNDNFIMKATLSASPLNSNCVVMAIVSDYRKASFCKLGESTWTTLDFFPNNFLDIALYGGMFYATRIMYDTGLVCDASVVTDVKEIRLPKDKLWSHKTETTMRYVVESNGKLLHIIRYVDRIRGDSIEIEERINMEEKGEIEENEVILHDGYYRTSSFHVFTMDSSGQRSRRWRKVKNLGNVSLFLGNSHSMSFSIQDFPQYRSNSIYFTDDYVFGGYFRNIHGCRDMGVFSLEDRRIEPFYPDAPVFLTPTFWITQTQ